MYTEIVGEPAGARVEPFLLVVYYHIGLVFRGDRGGLSEGFGAREDPASYGTCSHADLAGVIRSRNYISMLNEVKKAKSR